MSKRYYISKIEIIETDEGREVRCVAGKYGTLVAQNIELDQNGDPIADWALCVLESDNHAAAIADKDVTPLPQYSLDAKVSAMHTPTKSAMVNAFKARGITTDWIGNADGFREVVRTLGKMHNPAFDENLGSWSL